MNIGKRLREVRRSHGLASREMARSLNLRPREYSDLEEGKAPPPSLEQIHSWAQYWCVSLDWLFGDTEAEMWSPGVLALRDHIRGLLPGPYQALDDTHRRFCWLMDMITEALPDTFVSQAPHHLLLTTADGVESMRNGSFHLAGTAAAEILAEFTGVPLFWLLLGEYVPEDALTPEWVGAVRALQQRRIRPVTVQQHMRYLSRQQHRDESPALRDEEIYISQREDGAYSVSEGTNFTQMSEEEAVSLIGGWVKARLDAGKTVSVKGTKPDPPSLLSGPIMPDWK